MTRPGRGRATAALPAATTCARTSASPPVSTSRRSDALPDPRPCGRDCRQSGGVTVIPCVFAAALAAAPAITPGADAPGSPLNVVLVLIDDLGWTDFGCYGSDFHQ